MGRRWGHRHRHRRLTTVAGWGGESGGGGGGGDRPLTLVVTWLQWWLKMDRARDLKKFLEVCMCTCL